MDEIVPERRRELIREWLGAEGFLAIDQLARRFGVSTMTIHRDVDRLARAGLARKVRNGVTPVVDDSAQASASQARCAMCGKLVPPRTAWVVTSNDGEQWRACCAHCGLLRLHHVAGRQSVLAVDFLYGQMVNAFQATFVMGSDVTVCCVPSVLCFATRHDADRFRQGYGGELLDFDAAMAAMADAHHPR